MSYEEERNKAGRRHFWLVRMDIPECIERWNQPSPEDVQFENKLRWSEDLENESAWNDRQSLSFLGSTIEGGVSLNGLATSTQDIVYVDRIPVDPSKWYDVSFHVIREISAGIFIGGVITSEDNQELQSSVLEFWSHAQPSWIGNETQDQYRIAENISGNLWRLTIRFKLQSRLTTSQKIYFQPNIVGSNQFAGAVSFGESPLGDPETTAPYAYQKTEMEPSVAVGVVRQGCPAGLTGNKLLWSEDTSKSVWTFSSNAALGNEQDVNGINMMQPDRTGVFDCGVTQPLSGYIAGQEYEASVYLLRENAFLNTKIYFRRNNGDGTFTSVGATFSHGTQAFSATFSDISGGPSEITPDRGAELVGTFNGQNVWRVWIRTQTDLPLEAVVHGYGGASMHYAGGVQATPTGADAAPLPYLKTEGSPIGGTSISPCFNTEFTCQAPQAYNPQTRSYWFVEPMADLPIRWPDGIQPWPFVSDVSLAPGQINPVGGIGTRSSCSISMTDHPSSDLGIDYYLDQRDYIATERGTFWGKFRARNPFYENSRIVVYSCYLDEDGQFLFENSQPRSYITERITVPNNGSVQIKAKDPLRLLDDDRALAPKPSRGVLRDAIDDQTPAVFFLDPPDIGDIEYPASGLLEIGGEISSFTRDGDEITLTARGIRDKAAEAHDEGTTAQLVLQITGQAHEVAFELITDYTDVDPDIIPFAKWELAGNEFLPLGYSAEISEPTPVTDLLNELGIEAPNNIFWNERLSEVEFRPIVPPSASAPTITDDFSLIGSVNATDDPNMRISTVIVNHGRRDPTESMDKLANYDVTYVRTNPQRANQYGSQRIKRIDSRFITFAGGVQARNAAAVLGRRFGRTPRLFDFKVPPKDSGIWTGDGVFIETDGGQDVTGATARIPVQILSSQPVGDLYRYKAIEWLFDPAAPDDPQDDELLVLIGSDANNLNLRSLFEQEYPGVDINSNSLPIVFRIQPDVVIGSMSSSMRAIDVGTWPEAQELRLEILTETGIIAGAGGASGQGGSVTIVSGARTLSNGQNGVDGGVAIYTRHPITIANNGIIGGGGGGAGGGGAAINAGNSSGGGGGGGSAGRIVGQAGGRGTAVGGFNNRNGQDGSGPSLISGAAGGGGGSVAGVIGGAGGFGGSLGENGSSGQNGESTGVGAETTPGGTGGAAGPAVDGDSFVTWDILGDIRGARIN